MTATLIDLLKRLEKADPETFILLNGISRVLHGFDLKENPNERIIGHIIQGEIQKAIASRHWLLKQTMNAEDPAWEPTECYAEIHFRGRRSGQGFYQSGDSPIEAILAVYCDAIEGASQ